MITQKLFKKKVAFYTEGEFYFFGLFLLFFLSPNFFQHFRSGAFHFLAFDQSFIFSIKPTPPLTLPLLLTNSITPL